MTARTDQSVCRIWRVFGQVLMKILEILYFTFKEPVANANNN